MGNPYLLSCLRANIQADVTNVTIVYIAREFEATGKEAFVASSLRTKLQVPLVHKGNHLFPGD